MKVLTSEGLVYKRGENAQDNWNLLEQAKEDHIFFHLSKFPSCYVIMEVNNTNFSIDMCIIGAEFCKSGTKYKHMKDVKVDYCKCSNLIKGSETGQVIYKSKGKVHTLKV